jgi:subtilase family serine protease
MKKVSAITIRYSLLSLAVLFAFSGSRTSAQTKPDSAAATQAVAVPARITQAINETQLVLLRGNVHPLARSEFDQGAVSGSFSLNRMLLLLKRSMEQESSLTQLMLAQQDANSPSYHKWLTPEEFGAQFGPADADVQTVTSWLTAHGFQVAKVSKGKLAIEFSGTAAQVKDAFHTEIHHFLVNTELHVANASEPQIPAALASVVKGLGPLNDFRPKPHHRVVGEFTKSMATGAASPVRPDFNTSGGNFALGPTDFATIYNVLPLWNGTPAVDGTGQSIAVIGVSNINLQDVKDFRTLFGLPTGGAASTPVVVIDGNDPGIVNDGSETEALLDVEWSGAVAKGAQIHFVIAADTDVDSGLLLAIFNVVDNNSDPILSLSFGNCEPNEGANNTGLWQPLWEQAAAQGITVAVSTGDNGSAGCENSNAPAPNVATTGLQVSGFASTPFNVAVGGTDFNDGGTQSTYFGATNDPNTLASALSYIPESTWNDACTNASFNAITGMTTAEANCNSTNAQAKAAIITVGASGGASHCFTVANNVCSGGYAKPAYQSFSGLTGMPADGTRDLPDISLFASNGFNKSFYVVCEADAVSGTSCNKTVQFSFLGVGGTSASTPSFAGIMALVNQQFGRQGNANFVLYKLAQMQYAAGTVCNSLANPLPNTSCTFNDVTSGTIAMPCLKGSPNCTTNVSADANGVLSGFSSTPGYDLATGLGSVNANNLVNNWSKGLNTFTPSSVSLSLNPTTGIAAGQSVTVSITVTPSTATGDVSLTSNAATGDGVDGFPLGSGGKVTGTTTQLTGGTYQVTARYSGDGTFAPSTSMPVTVTVAKASSTATASVLVSNGAGGFATFTSGTAPVTLFLQASISPATVANNSPLTPTGTVSFVDTVNGVATTVASNVVVNQGAEAFTLPGVSSFAAGNHSIVATYSGDASFNPTNSAAAAFTITGGSPGAFSLNGTSSAVNTAPAVAGTNATGTSTITVAPSGGFAGAVIVTCGAIPGVTCSPLTIASGSTTGTLTINVADPSNSMTAMVLPQTQELWTANAPTNQKYGSVGGWWTLSAGTGFAALALLFIRGRKKYRAALGLGFVCVLSFTLGCGGGSSGGGGGGGVTPTVTHLTVSTTKVANSPSASITVSATVTGGTPTGGVQFFVDGTAVGGTAPVSGGTTGNITVTATQAPAFLQLVGTHSVSAHYLGDTTTGTSASGSLNVTVTGVTTVPVTGASGNTNANTNVSLTIN